MGTQRVHIEFGQGLQHHAGFFRFATCTPQVTQVQPNAQPFLQATSQRRFIVQCFVQSGHADERVLRHAAAAQSDLALVQHLTQNGSGVFGQSLGHGQQ